ncbi:MAG: hypothetical protein ACFFDN_10120 [Candidatus Hodarchaeota archaeon]
MDVNELLIQIISLIESVRNREIQTIGVWIALILPLGIILLKEIVDWRKNENNLRELANLVIEDIENQLRHLSFIQKGVKKIYSNISYTKLIKIFNNLLDFTSFYKESLISSFFSKLGSLPKVCLSKTYKYYVAADTYSKKINKVKFEDLGFHSIETNKELALQHFGPVNGVIILGCNALTSLYKDILKDRKKSSKYMEDVEKVKEYQKTLESN